MRDPSSNSKHTRSEGSTTEDTTEGDGIKDSVIPSSAEQNATPRSVKPVIRADRSHDRDGTVDSNSVSLVDSLKQTKSHNNSLAKLLDDPLTLAIVACSLLVSILAAFAAKKLTNTRNRLRGQMKKEFNGALSLKKDLENELFSSDGSGNVHAIGVGSLGINGGFVVNVYVEDSTKELRDDPLIDVLPEKFQDKPIVVVEMPRAVALSDDSASSSLHTSRTRVLHSGMSISNGSMWNEAGTLGYFCRPRLLQRAKRAFLSYPIYLLSNTHVMADLTLKNCMESKTIVQPGTGDGGGNKVAQLERFVTIDFDSGKEKPNRIDAAIALLDAHSMPDLLIPKIGEINGTLVHSEALLNTPCQKYGKETKHTNGRIENIHFSVWVWYHATNKSAFFSNQLLIVSDGPEDFCDQGDSGSLVVSDRDDKHLAVGLLFAGTGYGVANPIDPVLDEFRVKLLTK